jgi:hypothetical protein
MLRRGVVSVGKASAGLSRNSKFLVRRGMSGVEALLDSRRTHGNVFAPHLVQRKLSMIRTGRNLAAASRRTGGSSSR